MSRTRRRRRVARSLLFEALESRQLLHHGLVPWPGAEVVNLSIGRADRAARPADPPAHPRIAAAVRAQRAGLRAEMATIRQEWAALGRHATAGHVDRASVRAERADLVTEWLSLRREWASAGHSLGPSQPAAAGPLPTAAPIVASATDLPLTPTPAAGSNGLGAQGDITPFTSGGTVTIQAGPTTTAEGSAAAEFTITASPAPNGPLYVFYSFFSPTGTPGTDFTISPANAVTIAAGSTTATISVGALEDDSTAERLWGDNVTVNLTSATVSGSGGGSYTIPSPSTATVTVRDNDVGSAPQANSFCPTCPKTDLFPSSSASNGGNPASNAVSGSGIRYGSGQIQNVDPGLTSSGFGELFGPSLQWTNTSGTADNSPYGIGWVDSSLPTIQQTGNGGIMVVNSATSALWFDPQQNGTYTAEFYEGTEYTLQPDGSSGDFLMTDPNGDTVRFYGFESILPQAEQGTFKSFTDPAGNAITVTKHNTNGQITQVQRSATTNGVTTTESFDYSYLTSGLNTGLVQKVTLSREVGSGGFTTVRQAVFTYYDGTGAYGNQGDLETEQIEDASNNVLDTSYFRYYQPGDTAGFTDGLEYYLSPESYARAAAALGDPLTATNAQLAPYADDYYQYDSQQRVTLANVQGASATGPGTYTYSYYTSTNADGFNSWKTETVETLPDGNTNTVYTNYAGEVMLTDFYDNTDPANPTLRGQHWITLDRYDSQGRLIEQVQPSAVTSYNGHYYVDTYPDLMDFTGGTSNYLLNNTGVIDLHDYGQSTTATSTTAGDVLGYAKDDKVQVGQTGTPVLLDSTQYIAHTAGGVTVYPQATSTVYRNTDGTGAETTSDSYSWFAGTNAIQSDTTIAPVVSAAQNGPGPAPAAYLGTDTTTQGTWIGTYGGQGNDIEGQTASLPSYATVGITGASTYTWSTNTGDVRGLQNPGGSGRSAAAWYSSTSFTIDVNLTDGQVHDLALYAVDWDNHGRQEQVQVIDPATGAVLDSEAIASFTGGTYLRWAISGDVQITVTCLAGGNALISGLFLDAPTANSPAYADVTTAYYDTYGRPTWTKDGDGFINYTAYDNATGAVTTSITDVNTADTSEFTNLPPGWTTPPGGGLNLVTQAQVDGLGRPTEVTDPNGNVTYYVYNDPQYEVREYDGWNSSTGMPTGPTIVTREDRAGSYFETLTMSAAPHLTNGVPDGTEAISGIQTLERDYTDTAGRVTEIDQYFNLSGVTYSTAPHIGTLNANGTQNGNYYATYYGFDISGNPQRVQDANGTITDTLYDSLGRPTAVYVGTNDSTTNGGPWSPANASTWSNMIQTEQDLYDNNGVGDSNLTQDTQYADSTTSDNRVTQYAYDSRDRLVATKSGVQSSEDSTTHRPIMYYTLDNLGEVTAIAHYDGDGVTLTNSPPAASLLRAYEVDSYDDQGRLYKTQQYDVNQTTGAVSPTALTTNLYYDHRGDLIAESDPGGLWTKDQYDGAGRLISEAQTDGGGGATWAAAGSLTGDQVLTQTLTTYDANGNPILVAAKERFNTDTSTQTGPLGNPTTGPQARVYYTTSYYDAANRPTADVSVGTNGGTAYTRPGTVPTSSDTTLVTSYAYNAAGWLQTTTDPRGVVSQTSYDALGRVTQTIDDYTNGTPAASSNSTTNYTYDGLGDVLTVQAVMPSGTPSQTTQYVYGVGTTGGLYSNDLLAKVEYPDPTTGNPSTSASNQESYTYNQLGDTATFTDPNGTTHTYSYDVLGRPTADAVTTLGSGVDGSVLRQTIAYDTGDRPYLYTSYNAASGGSIVNQVQDVYNGLGQLTGEYQEQGGAVNPSTTPEVQYVYTEMAGGQNNSRLMQMIYPNGRTLDYVYNSGLDSSISRLSAIADDNSGSPGTTLEGYSYLGLATIVQYSHPEDGINLTYIQQTGDTHYINNGGDQYVGLDRFGRVIDQNWWNPTTQTSTDRFQYGYDRNGNVLYSNNLVNSAQSELYRSNSTQTGDSNTAYDGLGRQVAFARGTLSSSGNNGTQLDTIASPSRSQSWSLDAVGNWSGVTTNGSTTTRTSNAQNQTTSVSGGTAPTFDHNGNTTSDSGLTYVYNAWNQLVAAKNGSTTVAAYGYDALGRRITETYGSTTNHLYYSPQWQVIEERQNGTGTSNVTYQYVWGAGYVDELVLRDTYSGGVKTQRLYAQWDANFNVTALVNTSGQVQERYLYDPYGSVTVTDASWTPRSGNQSDFGWRYLFQGGRLDTTTGWYDFRNRDLIPSEGRWAERDPLGFGGGDLNEYRDTFNAPATYTDPAGLGPISWVYTGQWNPAPNVWDAAMEGTGPRYLQAYNDTAPAASYVLAAGSFAPGEVGWLASGVNVALASPYVLNPYDPDPNAPVMMAGVNPKGRPVVIIGRPVPRGPLARPMARGPAGSPRAPRTAGPGPRSPVRPTTPRAARYGTLCDQLPKGEQANHLNQNAAFRDVIPEEEGLAVGMRGNAITEPGSPHYNFHRSMEAFWSQFRRGGARYGQRPTNAEYGNALQQALESGAFTPAQAADLAAQAARQRAAYGLGEGALVPRIPGRMGQTPPPAATP